MHLDHEHEYPVEGEHIHPHTHTHTHENTHDGATHTHEHTHEHTHPHEHPHDHEHLHDAASSHDHTHTQAGLVALMKYMLDQNHDAYEKVMAAVADFEKGNDQLADVLRVLEEK